MLVLTPMPEEDTSSLSLSLSILFPLDRVSLNLELRPQAPGMVTPLSLTVLWSQALLATPDFNMGAGDLNSGPHARTACALLCSATSTVPGVLLQSPDLPSKTNLCNQKAIEKIMMLLSFYC